MKGVNINWEGSKPPFNRVYGGIEYYGDDYGDNLLEEKKAVHPMKPGILIDPRARYGRTRMTSMVFIYCW